MSVPPPRFFALLEHLEEDLQGLRHFKNVSAQRRTARRSDFVTPDKQTSNTENEQLALRGVAAVFSELNGFRHGEDLLWLSQRKSANCSRDSFSPVKETEGWDTEASWVSRCLQLLESVFNEGHGILAGLE